MLPTPALLCHPDKAATALDYGISFLEPCLPGIRGLASATSHCSVLSAHCHPIAAVGIQYRVASLGFLYFDTEDAPGNAGMFDQLMAMQWVKNNIAKFGGNPNNITLMEESAGACSVSLHLLSPLSRNLFSQAIMQSASALAPWGVVSKEEALRRSLALARNMDCPHDRKRYSQAQSLRNRL